MLTSCTLKPPNLNTTSKGIRCCFSFTIRRDPSNMLVEDYSLPLCILFLCLLISPDRRL